MHPAEQIAIIIGRIYRSGMTTTSGGNLSIMDSNGDMWITPAGIDKGSLKPSDIMCVKADGSIVGPHRPSSERSFLPSFFTVISLSSVKDAFSSSEIFLIKCPLFISSFKIVYELGVKAFFKLRIFPLRIISLIAVDDVIFPV